jgi:multicomponent Na+:H+ antiporter subunit B
LRILQYFILAAFGFCLFFAAVQLPPRGEVAHAPAHQTKSPVGTYGPGNYYIEHAYHDTHTPNMVTVVLADYRGFDTLGETTVVFAGGVAVFFVLRRRKKTT